MSETNHLMEITGLGLTYQGGAGDVEVLRGLDLTVDAGETLSIVGPSGSGKSSLMMLIGGLERPSAGEIKIDGQVLNGMSEDALARFRRDRIGIVFQDFHLVPTMTAVENVAIPLEFAGKRNPFKTAEEALGKVGLDHRLTHYPGQLSGGEQQRVALARAFAVEPKLLLADEPTGNLDGETGEKVIELLFDLAAEKRSTLILITHDMALADRCARTVKLVDGEIVSDSGGAARLAAQ
jgi:putative ABC transport system ATP-binding protein